MKVTLKVGANVDEALKGLNSVEKKTQNIQSAQPIDMKGLASNIGGAVVQVGKLAAAFTAAGAAAAAAFGAMAINKAAEFETLETNMANMLGSFTLAEERMQELMSFKMGTQFNLPEIVKASNALDHYSNGLLATSENLTLIGDAASRAGIGIEQVGEGAGKLFMSLETGVGFKTQLKQLANMRVLSAAAYKQLLKMQEAGAGKMEMWSVFEQDLQSASGSMDRFNNTWAGKMSALGDEWDRLLVTAGTPLIDSLSPILDLAIKGMAKMADYMAGFANDLELTISSLISAFESGEIWSMGLDVLQGGLLKCVDLLGRGFVAVGNGLLEHIKASAAVLLEAFNVVLKGEFWNGVWSGAKGVAKGFGASAQGVYGLAAEGIGMMTGSKDLEKHGRSQQMKSQDLALSAYDNYARGFDSINDATQDLQDTWLKGWSDIYDGMKKGFNSLEDDWTGAEKHLSSAAGNWAKLNEQARADKKKREEERAAFSKEKFGAFLDSEDEAAQAAQTAQKETGQVSKLFGDALNAMRNVSSHQKLGSGFGGFGAIDAVAGMQARMQQQAISKQDQGNAFLKMISESTAKMADKISMQHVGVFG